MIFASPTLPQCLPHSPETATVNMSLLSDDLIIQVPDSTDIPANWEVYPILGADPEEPDWEGRQQATGIWHDVSEDALKLNGIELRIPRDALETYLHQEIELRYKFVDESSMDPYSEPLRLTIES
ncbi:hypothetical protein JFT91_24285 [Pseudomonas sp. TH08]|uniref:hypothetical protein n=1 Tax=unclassified Pseudomonas TaxID=196821 RepID=UPI0019122F83|nr:MULTISPECIES: hypothetical protein [unclassified Pseudomonas]MBK5525730.1 hypothetical protein [Pseudomonas sp. TH06]MBK5535654.1 hypothetical protein [Pseudomonas sp. TH08]